MPAQALLAAPVRRPIGKFGGRLSRLTAAAIACLERAGGRLGVATLRVSGGMGLAALVTTEAA